MVGKNKQGMVPKLVPNLIWQHSDDRRKWGPEISTSALTINIQNMSIINMKRREKRDL